MKSELEAAGFKLVDEAQFLRNPDDPRDAPFFKSTRAGRRLRAEIREAMRCCDRAEAAGAVRHTLHGAAGSPR